VKDEKNDHSEDSSILKTEKEIDDKKIND